MKRIKIGLALGGGGARGTAHIGVWKALNELAIPIHLICGTSIGAIVGGLLAAGLDTAAMKKFFKQITISQMYALPGNEPAISQNSKLEQLLEKTIGRPDFSELKIPFSVVATDIIARKEIILADGDVVSAILASMAFPGLLPPVHRDGFTLMDGGMVNNVPFDVVRARGATHVIAVDLSNSAPYNQSDELDELDDEPIGLMAKALAFTQQRPLARVIATVADIITTQSVNARLAIYQPDLMLRPPVGTMGIFDIHRFDDGIELGYNETMLFTDQLKNMSNDQTQ